MLECGERDEVERERPIGRQDMAKLGQVGDGDWQNSK